MTNQTVVEEEVLARAHARGSGAEFVGLALLLVAGTGLRLWQYFGCASLWLDELAIAENVIGRPLRTLIGEPLSFDQIAPPGFLAAIKGTTVIFGTGELALRLFPLVCSLAALPLFAAVARRMLSGRGTVFATALFALGVPFIAHGSEVKQYSCDVAVALMLALTALDLPEGLDRGRWPYWRAGLTGVFGVWFSQPAVFMLVGLGIAIAAVRLLGHGHGRATLAALAPTLGLWAAAALSSAAWSLHLLDSSTRAFMGRFWAGAFPDLSPRHRFGLAFLATRLRDFWGAAGMLYRLPVLFVVLAGLGIAVLWVTRREHALFLLGPPAVAFGAAAAHLYPFEGRFLLFAGPSFLIAAASGAALVADWLAGARIPRYGTAAALALPALLALAQNPPVVRHEEARPVFAQLGRRRRPGDAIYLYYVAGPAMRYYGPRFGISPFEVNVGGCHGGDLAAYLRDLDRFRGGSRVWVLILRAPRSLAQQETMRAYAARIGSRLEGYAVPEGEGEESTLELFDFSDRARLAAASVDTFPLPSVNQNLAARLGCGHGPH